MSNTQEQGGSQRDTDAFAQVYDLTAERVFGVVLHVVRDPAVAAEVTEEVYLELWRGAGRGLGNTTSRIEVLMAMAHRLAVDRIRSLRAEGSVQTCRVDVCPTILGRAAVGNDAHPVRHALAHLSATQRRVIELSYFCAHTPSEVAQILDLPLDTVTGQSRGGLMRLHRSLLESRTHQAAHQPVDSGADRP